MPSKNRAVLTTSCSTLHWMSSCGEAASVTFEKRRPRRAKERKDVRIILRCLWIHLPLRHGWQNGYIFFSHIWIIRRNPLITSGLMFDKLFGIMRAQCAEPLVGSLLRCGLMTQPGSVTLSIRPSTAQARRGHWHRDERWARRGTKRKTVWRTPA